MQTGLRRAANWRAVGGASTGICKSASVLVGSDETRVMVIAQLRFERHWPGPKRPIDLCSDTT